MTSSHYYLDGIIIARKGLPFPFLTKPGGILFRPAVLTGKAGKQKSPRNLGFEGLRANPKIKLDNLLNPLTADRVPRG
jgi:hypothetical protein